MVFNQKEYMKIYRERNKENSKKYRIEHKEYASSYHKKRNEEMKLRIYNHYSNFDIKCNCCGEKMIEFLSMDHINNNGAKHRKEVGGGYSLYNWIIKNNFPSGFQLLCHNCNFAKGKDECHICPHKHNIQKYLKSEELDVKTPLKGY